jgi:hypothetical protein
MKPWWIVLLMCLMAAGCDYNVPLATRPELDADPGRRRMSKKMCSSCWSCR